MLLGGTVQHLIAWTATRWLFGIAGWALLVTVLLVAAALALQPLRAVFGALERLFYAATIAWFLLLGVQLIGVAKPMAEVHPDSPTYLDHPPGGIVVTSDVLQTL